MTGLHTLKRVTQRPRRRAGRGQSSGRGKTAGRGTKGQNARAGRKKRPELRDIIKKIPKRRGYGKNRASAVNSGKIHPTAVSLEKVERVFEQGAEVTVQALLEKGILRTHSGKAPVIKVLGTSLQKRLSFKNIVMSASAKKAVESAGGSVT